MNEAELNELLERWDQTDPEIQRAVVVRFVERVAKLEALLDHRTIELNATRAALLPFAAAAGRLGRLTDNPLPDYAVLALGVKVSAWKTAMELTGEDLE